MHIEEIREYCLSKKGATEHQPFGPDVLVWKIGEKLFALCPLDGTEMSINLKCDPEWAISLRESHGDIIPGWHMNKKHWNTVYTERGLHHELIKQLIDHSYDLIVDSLPLKIRSQFRDEG